MFNKADEYDMLTITWGMNGYLKKAGRTDTQQFQLFFHSRNVTSGCRSDPNKQVVSNSKIYHDRESQVLNTSIWLLPTTHTRFVNFRMRPTLDSFVSRHSTLIPWYPTFCRWSIHGFRLKCQRQHEPIPPAQLTEFDSETHVLQLRMVDVTTA